MGRWETPSKSLRVGVHRNDRPHRHWSRGRSTFCRLLGWGSGCARPPPGQAASREQWGRWRRLCYPVFWIDRFHPHDVKQHTAFVARDRAEVDAFHAAALKAGGTDNGPPGLRDTAKGYPPGYYAAFVLCRTKADHALRLSITVAPRIKNTPPPPVLYRDALSVGVPALSRHARCARRCTQGRNHGQIGWRRRGLWRRTWLVYALSAVGNG